MTEINKRLSALDVFLRHHASVTKMLERLVSEDIYVKQHKNIYCAPNEDVLNRLKVKSEALFYRNVSLHSNNYLLSTANNWFVFNQLQPEMLKKLEETEQPFGSVVRELKFSRQTFSTEFFPKSFEENKVILRHRAILYSVEQGAFSFVEESYLPITLKLFISMS